MNRQRGQNEPHSFAIHSPRQKDELFVKKSDRDQIALRAKKFASNS